MKILVGAYRSWAQELVRRAFRDDDWTLAETPDDLLGEYDRRRYDLAVLIGWSWLLPSAMVRDIPCICLHPSPLPKYRGGSPLQWQILAGETDSAITIFRMNEQVDAGPIYMQNHLSLAGSLDDIFGRIVRDGAPMLANVIKGIADGTMTPLEQTAALDRFPVLKRRKPEQSEITLLEWMTLDALEIHNRIRATAHADYPLAFMQTPDGGRVFFTGSEYVGPGVLPGTIDLTDPDTIEAFNLTRTRTPEERAEYREKWIMKRPEPTQTFVTTPDSYGVQHEVNE